MPGLSGLNLPRIVADGTPLLDIISQARALSPDGSLSAVAFLYAVQSELGIPFTETRDLFEYFSSDWTPLVDEAVIEERWQNILQAHGK